MSYAKLQTTAILPKGFALWTPKCSALRFSHFLRAVRINAHSKRQIRYEFHSKKNESSHQTAYSKCHNPIHHRGLRASGITGDIRRDHRISVHPKKNFWCGNSTSSRFDDDPGTQAHRGAAQASLHNASGHRSLSRNTPVPRGNSSITTIRNRKNRGKI